MTEASSSSRAGLGSDAKIQNLTLLQPEAALSKQPGKKKKKSYIYVSYKNFKITKKILPSSGNYLVLCLFQPN